MKKTSKFRLSLILYCILLLFAMVMALQVSRQCYSQRGSDIVKDVKSLHRETVRTISDDYYNLSEDMTLISMIFSHSQYLQEILLKNATAEDRAAADDARRHLAMFLEEYEGKIRAFQLYNLKGGAVFHYPEDSRLPRDGDIISNICSITEMNKFPAIFSLITAAEKGRTSPYLIYATPIYSPGDENRIIGIFCSWVDMEIMNRDFVSRIGYEMKNGEMSHIFLLSFYGQVLYHSGSYEEQGKSLSSSGLADFINSLFDRKNRNSTGMIEYGEKPGFYYAYAPIDMTVNLRKGKVVAPGFHVLLISPKSAMQKKLTSLMIYIIAASAGFFLILIALPAILIFRYLYELEKERASAYEKDLKLSYDIQMEFLPHEDTRLAGYDIYGSSTPARYVGGDFYDLIPAGKDLFAFIIGDVSGKGLASALMMTVAKTFMNYMAHRTDAPETVLREANHFLYKSSRSGLFITAMAGYLDTTRNVLSYSLGGHNAPMLFRDGHTSDLDGDGTILGCFPEIKTSRQEIQLLAGDILIFYTDGFIDVWNEARQRIDEGRLWETVHRIKDSPAKEIASSIYNAVEEFQGKGTQFDDRTIIVLKVEGNQPGSAEKI